MICNLCGGRFKVERYQVGAVRGHLCGVCTDEAGIALAAWSLKRLRAVHAERAELERRAAEEARISAANPKESSVAVGDVSDEQLPLSTRRAMKVSAA